MIRGLWVAASEKADTFSSVVRRGTSTTTSEGGRSFFALISVELSITSEAELERHPERAAFYTKNIIYSVPTTHSFRKVPKSGSKLCAMFSACSPSNVTRNRLHEVQRLLDKLMIVFL